MARVLHVIRPLSDLIENPNSRGLSERVRLFVGSIVTF